jgi:polysaccharide biosynthesis protein PslG
VARGKTAEALGRCAALAGLGLTVALLLVAPASARAEAPPPEFFGLQSWKAPSLLEFQRMAQAGVGTYRVGLDWYRAQEFEYPAYDWSELDRRVERAAAVGLQVLPVIIGSPGWVAKHPSYLPHTRAQLFAYRQFVQALVGRYGRGGEFWATHAGRPFTAWQAWNEANFPRDWPDRRPRARPYLELLKVTRAAIRARDPRATIVLAGSTDSHVPGNVPTHVYLARLYSLGARRYFNVAALHPYARTAKELERSVIRNRRVMARYGDSRKRMWITEFGWASAGPPKNSLVTDGEGQAQQLEDALSMLIAKRSRYRIDRAMWFSWRDRNLSAGERDGWSPHSGLFSVKGQPKPAWTRLVQLTGGVAGHGELDPLVGECLDAPCG